MNIKKHIISPMPEDYYLLTKDWVESVKSGQIYRECYPEQVIYRQEPKHLEKELHWKFRIGTEHNSPAAFVAFLPGGRVLGTNGAVISPDNKLLADVSLEFILKPEEHSIFHERKTRQLEFTQRSNSYIVHRASGSISSWAYGEYAEMGLRFLTEGASARNAGA